LDLQATSSLILKQHKKLLKLDNPPGGSTLHLPAGCTGIGSIQYDINSSSDGSSYQDSIKIFDLHSKLDIMGQPHCGYWPRKSAGPSIWAAASLPMFDIL